MSPERSVVIEVFGEGKTDVGYNPEPHEPNKGVVPILLYTLCGKPKEMLVKRYGMPFMQQKGTLAKKVGFAKRQARLSRSAAVTFVVDSEGDLAGRMDDLTKGRTMEPSEFPMAVGVAHPCIEAWLLADATAVRRALGLARDPQVPESPESLPAPRHNRADNPKTRLARMASAATRELPVTNKESIAAAMNDINTIRDRCPQGFAPFADEVEQYIRPLF